MLLGDYFRLKCGYTESYGVNRIEKLNFKIADTSKGWFKRLENIEVSDSLILETCNNIIESNIVKPKALRLLTSLRDSLLNKDLKAYNPVEIGKEYLYLMQNELDMFKIGISKTPEQRAKSISSGSGLEVKLISYYTGIEPARDVEYSILYKLKSHLKLGEWFKVNTISVEQIEFLLPKSYVRIYPPREINI